MMNRLLLPLLLLCSTLTTQAEEYTVYFRPGTNSAAMARLLAPLRAAEPQSECRYVVLSEQASTLAEAINAANALKAGVQELPCLVIGDASGPYTTLPLDKLTPATLAAAKAAASAPDRAAQADRRNFTAQQYLLFARMAFTQPLAGEALQKCLNTCRALMAHPQATAADKQRLGFECLYPLLLQEYTTLYTGAHTPASEAKLLEAIAALEAARDADRNSTIGKKAHAERERLRAARRQARTME